MQKLLKTSSYFSLLVSILNRKPSNQNMQILDSIDYFTQTSNRQTEAAEA